MSIALSHLGPATNARLACPLQPLCQPHSLDPQGREELPGAGRRGGLGTHCFDLGHQRPGNAISSEEHLLSSHPQQAQAQTPPHSPRPRLGPSRLAKGPGQQTGKATPIPKQFNGNSE